MALLPLSHHHSTIHARSAPCRPSKPHPIVSFLAPPASVSAGLWYLGTKRPTPQRSAFFVSNGSRWSAGQWLDSTAQVEVDVPLSVAWDLWADRERVNRWMPWIHSIKILEDKPQFSEWLLKYNAFGQDFEFKWIAKNLQPIYHQKIHWKSVDGIQNRGTVRFYPRGPSSVGVQLTISYEVPDVLAPLAASVSPLVESILQNDLDRFAAFAKDYNLKAASK